MFFKQLFDPASSTLTYLIADDSNHEAVLIDPVTEQVERDVRLLREHGLKLKYTLETHVHADHVTAAQALSRPPARRPRSAGTAMRKATTACSATAT